MRVKQNYSQKFYILIKEIGAIFKYTSAKNAIGVDVNIINIGII